MIAHLSIPGQNLQIAYEYLEIHDMRLFIYRSSQSANSRSLEACYAYFTAQYQLINRDVIARLVVNEDMANQIYITRLMQGQFIEGSINERERNIFLENNARIDRMIDALLAAEFRT